MTQEDKQLLLIDLCGRLPYEVKCKYYDCCEGDYGEGTICGFERQKYIQIDGVCIPIEEVKPYLRPLSSMTEEELHEAQKILGKGVEIREDFILSVDSSINAFTYLELIAIFDWLNVHHFDYRGLIPKDLAIEITEENNPYKD